MKDNFFSVGANARNSSEAPTAAMVELAGKTIYLLEELPMGKLHSSMLKSIASKDTMKGRALYKGMQSVRITGKLVINANAAPEIGEEGPVWDRTVLIPWDTRYVNDGDALDIPNYRLPSNNTKKQHIVSLKSAFVTVCLKELNKFLNLPVNRDVDGTLKVNEIPQPRCVKEMVSKAKERGFPLKMFVKTYTAEEFKGKTDLTVNTFFNAYRGFLRTRNIRSAESLDDIAAKLCRVGIQTRDVDGTLVVDGCRLTENGMKLAEREAINMRVDVPDPATYAISRAFQRHEEQHDSDDDRSPKRQKRRDVIQPSRVYDNEKGNIEDLNDFVPVCPPPIRRHVRNSKCIMTGCLGPHATFI